MFTSNSFAFTSEENMPKNNKHKLPSYGTNQEKQNYHNLFGNFPLYRSYLVLFFFLDTLLSDFLQLFFIVSFEFKKCTAFFIVLLVAVVRTPLKLCVMDQTLATLLEPSATRQLRMALNLK